MILRYITIALLFTLFYDGAMAQEKQNISTWIEKETSAENLRFTVYAKNNSENTITDLSYQFHGCKKSESGTSNIKQSGKFEAKPGKKISLSTLGLNNIQKGIIDLKLEIYYKDSLIAVDSLIINP